MFLYNPEVQMQHVKYGIRAWNNQDIQRKCLQCGKLLGEYYIRVNSYYFCPITQDQDGLNADCFSQWAVNTFPRRLAARMIVELPTPEMQP